MKTTLPVATTLEWTKLGLQWMEMMAASGQVIERRTRRAPTPAQWMRMGNEKVEAALASGSAMSRHMVGFPMNDALSIWHAWAKMLASGMQPYHSRAVRNARTRRRAS
jgi:hypothetical protein